MLIIRIKTRDLLRVTRKFDTKRARILAVTSEDQSFDVLYAVDEYQERD
jgi:hypothetical protein